MMIGQMIREFVQEYLLCRYNPDRHTLPDRRTKKRNSDTDTDKYNLADSYTIVAGRPYKPDNEFLTYKDTVADAAWSEAKPSTNNQRTETLTDKDIEELNARKQDVAKARLVKPLWATDTLSNAEITAMLKKKYKGFGRTNVSLMCAAFSAALSPTEE